MLHCPPEVVPELDGDTDGPGHDPDQHHAPDQRIEGVSEPQPRHEPPGAAALPPLWQPVHCAVEGNLDLQGAAGVVHPGGRVVSALERMEAAAFVTGMATSSPEASADDDAPDAASRAPSSSRSPP